VPGERDRRRNVALAVGFGVLLAAVVGSRLWVAWSAGSPGSGRRIAAVVVLVLFVGVPAAYGLRGLVRGDDDSRDR
jgi:hypothetical protein